MKRLIRNIDGSVSVSFEFYGRILCRRTDSADGIALLIREYRKEFRKQCPVCKAYGVAKLIKVRRLKPDQNIIDFFS